MMNTRKRRLAEHQHRPVSATQAIPMPSRVSNVAPVNSGTLHGALLTKSFLQQRANPRITEQLRLEQRQRRQQKHQTMQMCAVCLHRKNFKLGRQNHQAPQPRSQLALKMDHAVVGRRSPSEKKECIAKKITGQLKGPGSLKHLCSIFLFNGIFVNI
ncbi:Cadherin-related hmr-1 [Labeo rohita]|uniref:Cadherin-related hmr-1 n=1 Tax=Labeo rohita TaxID=84645 RepID=A0ABQ8LET0_LABRO|nr:Cadherin-related hmr-1 [Labeo rohita]